MEWCMVVQDGVPQARLAGAALEEIAFGLSGAEQDAESARAMATLEARLSLIVFGADELSMVPGDGSAPWTSVAQTEDESLGRILDRLGAGWRVGDTDVVNGSIRDLAEALGPMQAGAGVKAWSLELERVITQFPLLSVVVLLYAAASGIAGFGALRIARGVMAGAVGLHLLAMTARALVLDCLPIQNHYESMAAVAAMVGLGGLLLSRRGRHQASLVASAAIAAGLLAVAEWIDMPGRVLELEAGILSSTAILKYHVLIILAGYALILLGAGVGGGVLLRRARGANLDDIASMHRLQVSLGYWVFWVLGVGILLGAVWADRAWGRWWAFDPKETWALITWLIYLGMVHIPASKLSAHRRPVTVAILHLLGFAAMLWTYFGVNLLLPSLHSYA
jgi:ABC-type transport system involved in cytochrome c biogenesis permease subunit